MTGYAPTPPTAQAHPAPGFLVRIHVTMSPGRTRGPWPTGPHRNPALVSRKLVHRSVALLILLSAATRTRIISTDLFAHRMLLRRGRRTRRRDLLGHRAHPKCSPNPKCSPKPKVGAAPSPKNTPSQIPRLRTATVVDAHVTRPVAEPNKPAPSVQSRNASDGLCTQLPTAQAHPAPPSRQLIGSSGLAEASPPPSPRANRTRNCPVPPPPASSSGSTSP